MTDIDIVVVHHETEMSQCDFIAAGCTRSVNVFAHSCIVPECSGAGGRILAAGIHMGKEVTRDHVLRMPSGRLDEFVTERQWGNGGIRGEFGAKVRKK